MTCSLSGKMHVQASYYSTVLTVIELHYLMAGQNFICDQSHVLREQRTAHNLQQIMKIKDKNIPRRLA